MSRYAASVPVKTKTVEIKVLQIDGKQASLAMIRQLPKKCILDHQTGDLLGLEWGLVRYVWPNCCWAFTDGPKYPHDHVVWESNGKLYLCSIQDCHQVSSDAKEIKTRLSSQIGYLEKLDQLFIGV